MNNFKQILVGGLLTFVAFTAQALPIVGSMDIGGSAILLDDTFNMTDDASSAIIVDFTRDKFRVLTADGDFAATAGQIGNIQDFAFTPFSAPIVDFWTVDIFSFELTDIMRGDTNNSGNVLVLNGTGVISAAGFDDTAASWSFTGSSTGNGAFSWSAASATDVPEPGMLALLSLGLIVIGFRKKV